MTPEKVAELYEKYREDAIAVCVSKGFTHAIAEDAVQEAAIFFLTKQRSDTVTKSLFIQYVCRRAHHVKRAAYGDGQKKGKAQLEIHVGDINTLATFEKGFQEAEEK